MSVSFLVLGIVFILILFKFISFKYYADSLLIQLGLFFLILSYFFGYQVFNTFSFSFYAALGLLFLLIVCVKIHKLNLFHMFLVFFLSFVYMIVANLSVDVLVNNNPYFAICLVLCSAIVTHKLYLKAINVSLLTSVSILLISARLEFEYYGFVFIDFVFVINVLVFTLLITLFINACYYLYSSKVEMFHEKFYCYNFVNFG